LTIDWANNIHKTVLSIIAWIIFATLIFGRKSFGWRGKQTVTATQIGFGILVLAYYGSKFVKIIQAIIERMVL
jgi:ABC-type uncharacterized transport system permease subunit